MAQSSVNLPPGFVLDDPSKNLPPGFVLDKEAAAAPEPKQMIPQGSSIRPPLTLAERARNAARDVVPNLPILGTAVGGMLGGLPGAAAGAGLGGLVRKATDTQLGGGGGIPLTGQGATDTAKEVAKRAAEGAAIEGIGQLLSKAPAIPSAIKRISESPSVRGITTGIGDVPIISSARKGYNAYKAAEFERGLNRITNTSPNAVEAGETVQRGVQGVIDKLHGVANQAYDALRGYAGQATKTMQVGEVESTLLDEYGKPFTKPVTKTLSAPVNMKVVKARIRPLVSELDQKLPITELQSSPGLKALKQILAGEDYVSLNSALDNLSAIGDLFRDASPGLRSKSEGIAAQVSGPLQAQITQVVHDLGPNAEAAWKAGRKATALKWDVAKLQKLSKEPAQLIRQLTAPGDTMINQLRRLDKYSPVATNEVASATLEGIRQRSLSADNHISLTKARNAWNQIGPETKKILFGPKLPDVERFFRSNKLTQFLLSSNGKPLISPAAARPLALIGAEEMRRVNQIGNQ